MQAFTNKQLDCPTFFFGKTKIVYRNWKSICNSAWNDGEWMFEKHFNEHVSIEDISTLWIDSDSKYPDKTNNHWHLHLIGITLKEFVCNTNADSISKYNHLMLTGMKNFWFTLGTLQSGCGHVVMSNLQRTNSTEVFAAFLGNYVHWLDKMIIYENRFYKRHLGVRNSVIINCNIWYATISHLLTLLGWQLEYLNPYSSYSLVKYMVQHDIIRIDNNGCYSLFNSTPV